MKRKNDNEKPRRGRPQKLGEADLERIMGLARAGLSLPQMAGELATSRKSLQTLFASLPEFRAEVQAARQHATALAKIIVLGELEQGDISTAKWILERESRLKLERERIRMLREQRRVLELTNTPERCPDALTTSEYWKKVDEYFTHRDNPKPESTEAEASDKGDTAEAGDPGDKAGD